MFYQITSEGLDCDVPEIWTDHQGARHQVRYQPQTDRDSFFIDVARLRFPDGPYLSGLNLWPGAEWLNHCPVWSSPIRQAADGKKDLCNRAQVWERSPDQRLCIIDQYGGLRLLAHKTQWTLQRPDQTFVVAYLRHLGVNAFSIKTVDFAWHNLDCLSKGFGLDLRHELAQLDKRRRELM